jgi:hypothetical protein
VDNEPISSKRSFASKYVVVIIAVVVIVAGVLFGVTFFKGAALPVLAPSYRCVPASLIPQLKPGQSTTLSATYGGFSASFHSDVQPAAPSNFLSVGVPFKGTLTVSDASTTWSLPSPARADGSQIDALCVIAFTPVQHPGVMIEGFTGGAHCCQVPVIYLFNSAQNRYVKVVDMSPYHYVYSSPFDSNQGFIPMVTGKKVLLKTGDDRFAYAFGCYACSAVPLALYSVDVFGLADATMQHRSIVAADAQSLLKVAEKATTTESSSQPYSPFGFLAPWVADECSLGRGAKAWPTLELLQREGKLSDALYHQETQNHGSFLLDLRSFLLSDGYCTGQI